MAINPHISIDENDVAQAIRSGDLQLAEILQNVWDGDEDVASQMADDIVALGGTAKAGRITQIFAAAMADT